MKTVGVDLAKVREIIRERKRINRAKLECLVFRDRMTTFTASPDQIEEWKFTGMSNMDFIDFMVLQKRKRLPRAAVPNA